jgi:hypothetical protein
VVVYGGNGFFGRLVVDDLLANTDVHLVIASRQSRHSDLVNPRVSFARSDLNDVVSVEATLSAAAVVVNCAGPYQGQPPTLMRQAIVQRLHYIDLAEEREFVREAQTLDETAKRAGVTLLSGLSVVPGMAALLAQSLRDRFDEVRSIRTFVAPGTRGSRGSATVRTLLGGVGRPLRLLRDGREMTVCGWSEPEWIELPPPIGWRLEYLAVENADSDVLFREFGVERAEFKAGSEFSSLNRSLALIARLRRRTGFPPLDRGADTIRKCLKCLGWFGTDAGGVLVEVDGTKNGEAATQQIAVVAERHGERIPSVLAAIAVGALSRNELVARGAVPLSTWINKTRFCKELRARGLKLWLKPLVDAAWHPLIE